MPEAQVLALVALGAALAVTIAVIRDRIMEEKIMGKTADNLKGVTAKVDKIKGEFQAALADFAAQLDAKGNLDAEDTKAIDELNTKLDELDNLNPDKPAVVPTPADQVVENADTTGDVTGPVTGDIVEHIEDGTPLPDPTNADEDVATDGSDQSTAVEDAEAASGSDPVVGDNDASTGTNQ